MANHKSVKFPCGTNLVFVDGPIRGDEIEDDELVSFATDTYITEDIWGNHEISLELRSIPVLVKYLQGIYDYYCKGLVTIVPEQEAEGIHAMDCPCRECYIRNKYEPT
jgi:hypothetical protein